MTEQKFFQAMGRRIILAAGDEAQKCGGRNLQGKESRPPGSRLVAIMGAVLPMTGHLHVQKPVACHPLPTAQRPAATRWGCAAAGHPQPTQQRWQRREASHVCSAAATLDLEALESQAQGEEIL
jgi:hypothetical protein